jgi:hypothetical protein
MTLPTFTTTRLTRSVPSCAPAASPWVRRRPSPWPPPRPRNAKYGVATERWRALQTGPYPPGWSRRKTYGALALVPHVHLLVSLAGPRPSGSTGLSRRCQGCSHPHVRLHAQAALSFTGLLRQTGGGVLSSPPGSGGASWRTPELSQKHCQRLRRDRLIVGLAGAASWPVGTRHGALPSHSPSAFIPTDRAGRVDA